MNVQEVYLNLKYNDKIKNCMSVYLKQNNIDIRTAGESDLIQYYQDAFRLYEKSLAIGPAKTVIRPVTKKRPATKKRKKQAVYKKPKTVKQKQAIQLHRERLQTAKSDMIDHIIDQIKTGYYTTREFMADPTAYLDKAIMGNYINNPILVKSIEKEVIIKMNTEA